MSFDQELRLNVVVKIINKIISTCKIRLQFNLLARFVYYRKRNKLTLILVFKLAS